ncbi:helicase-like protein [Trifolium medium]|uniref:Helicase-like protein n=1 Tax=Trifolium medium TaxID=97028 RepID=A0A392NYL4_9FABA|nr:helicase-like protein [Trifolium medium]
MCCCNGKVQLPLLKEAPRLLRQLLFDQTSPDNKKFQQNIRSYNSMFAFTSPGMKFDDTNKGGRGPPIIRIQGQTCHRIGSLLPITGQPPKFGQLYIYDTDNEIQN